MLARASVLVMALALTVVTFFPVEASAQQTDAADITREDINTVLENMIGVTIDRQLKTVGIDVGNVALAFMAA